MFVKGGECYEETMENGAKRKIKGWIDDLMVAEIVWQKGRGGVDVHSHPHRQCCYVVKGSFEARLNGATQVLEAGDCMYVEAGQPHGLIALEAGSVCLDIFTPCREDFIANLPQK